MQRELTEVIINGRPFRRRRRRRGRRLLLADNAGDLVGVAVVAVQVVALVDGGLGSLALDVVVRKVAHRVAELAARCGPLGPDVAELFASDVGLEEVFA